MDDNKLGSLYNNIAQTVIETIPEEWSEVFVYGEILEDVRTAFFYYYPENSSSPVHSHNIPELFEMERAEYKVSWRRLLDALCELWAEFKKNEMEPWTNLTMIFNRDGGFKIEYDYEDLSDADDFERRIIWKHKYLNLVPEDEDDKKFLEEYLNRIEGEQS